MPEDTVLVEGETTVGGEVRGDPGAFRDAVSKGEKQRGLPRGSGKALWKCVGEPFHELKQRKVRIRQRISHQPRASASLEHALEITQEAWQALVQEVLRRLMRRIFLVFVVE